MALFEGYERRIDKINGVLKEYGISSVEECRDICLAKGVDAIILTCGAQMPAELLKRADEKGVLIIATEYNTLKSVRLLYQAVPVSSIMQTKLTTFEKDELVSEMQEVIKETNFNHYPVVEDGKLIGIIRRDNLVVPEKEKIILVDHNEKGQAVEGIGSAKVVEMIDHHRLGGMETSDPIFIHYEPVGCTCTIAVRRDDPAEYCRPPSLGDPFGYGPLQIADLHAER